MPKTDHLSPTDVARSLSAKFLFTNQVNSVIKSCFISLRDLHHIRRFLSVDTSVVIANALVSSCLVCLFVYLGFYVAFNTVQVISRWVVGRAEETSTYSPLGFCTVLFCTNGKQLPAFPLTAMMGIEPRPQRWEARVLPLCHRSPEQLFGLLQFSIL